MAGYRNIDEVHIMDIANTMLGATARLATQEEDCGHQKADVVIGYNRKTYYLQVSHTPKSNKEQRNLLRRGTYPISTHKFIGQPYPYSVLIGMISDIMENKYYKAS